MPVKWPAKREGSRWGASSPLVVSLRPRSGGDRSARAVWSEQTGPRLGETAKGWNSGKESRAWRPVRRERLRPTYPSTSVARQLDSDTPSQYQRPLSILPADGERRNVEGVSGALPSQLVAGERARFAGRSTNLHGCSTHHDSRGPKHAIMPHRKRTRLRHVYRDVPTDHRAVRSTRTTSTSRQIVIHQRDRRMFDRYRCRVPKLRIFFIRNPPCIARSTCGDPSEKIGSAAALDLDVVDDPESDRPRSRFLYPRTRAG